MKTKFRFTGRGGQGIKFVGSTLAKVAMAACYHTTVSLDYTPSVRGGPIFCDIVISSEPISYPYCDRDANIFIVLDQEGFERASEIVCEMTTSFVDVHTVVNPEKIISKGSIYRVPFTKRADDNQITAAVNILSLGFLSKYIGNKSPKGEFPALEDKQYHKVFDSMPPRFREANALAFKMGKQLYGEMLTMIK
jgi:2-oxoglutarate ferredoxin oxidoreductase subunit gamma